MSMEPLLNVNEYDIIFNRVIVPMLFASGEHRHYSPAEFNFLHFHSRNMHGIIQVTTLNSKLNNYNVYHKKKCTAKKKSFLGIISAYVAGVKQVR